MHNAGVKSHTVRLPRSVPNVSDIFCTISLDRKLIDDAILPKLNPLTIRILSLNSLPTTPYSYDELDDSYDDFLIRNMFCASIVKILRFYATLLVLVYYPM